MTKLAPSTALLALATLIACAPESGPDAEATFVAGAESTFAADAALTSGDFVEGQVIVTLKAPDFNRKDAVSMRGQRLPVKAQLRGGRSVVVTLPEGVSVAEGLAELRASGRFEAVEPDAIYAPFASVDDPERGSQYHLDTLDVEGARDYSTGAGVLIAVIDTGTDGGGADGMDGVIQGWDFFDGDADTTDGTNHGTAVAGAATTDTDNGVGVASPAPDAEVLAVRVCGPNGCTSSRIIQGIDYAVAEGADVINLSLGGGTYHSTMQASVDDAVAAGILVVAAAGNSGNDNAVYPAGYAGVVSVGSTTSSDALSSFSSYGVNQDLVAPGSGIYVEKRANDGSWSYGTSSGTSLASPLVAASGALLMSMGASAAEAETYLIDSAADLGDAGWDESFGHGLVQPAAALDAYAVDNWGSYCSTAANKLHQAKNRLRDARNTLQASCPLELTATVTATAAKDAAKDARNLAGDAAVGDLVANVASARSAMNAAELDADLVLLTLGNCGGDSAAIASVKADIALAQAKLSTASDKLDDCTDF